MKPVDSITPATKAIIIKKYPSGDLEHVLLYQGSSGIQIPATIIDTRAGFIPRLNLVLHICTQQELDLGYKEDEGRKIKN